jgi:hypothetical protein
LNSRAEKNEETVFVQFVFPHSDFDYRDPHALSNFMDVHVFIQNPDGYYLMAAQDLFQPHHAEF